MHSILYRGGALFVKRKKKEKKKRKKIAFMVKLNTLNLFSYIWMARIVLYDTSDLLG